MSGMPPRFANVSGERSQYLLNNGLARQSSSWASPCLLVNKSDGTYRFCTDYRKLNRVTKVDSFPLPRMEDCVDQVGSAKFVSKFDLLKGYWQVPLTERAREVSAFITPSGFLQGVWILYLYPISDFNEPQVPRTTQNPADTAALQDWSLTRAVD